MKLSLHWLFDHIKGGWKGALTAEHIIARIAAVSAEIDGTEQITTPLELFALGQVLEIHDHELVCEVPEWKRRATVPHQGGALEKGALILLKVDGAVRRATLQDVGGEKALLMPPLWCPEDQVAGGWKQHVESTDFVITVDNKSLTNRPDLWGHRGFARELVAVCGGELLPEEFLVSAKPVKHYDETAPVNAALPFSVALKTSACRRLAAMNISQYQYRASLPHVAIRLARIGGRPIDALVDATNYVMNDIGHPIHAFDAEYLAKRPLEARWAHAGEKLTLLDGQKVILDAHDCVIAAGDEALSLAGVMGGLASAISPKTTAVVLEAGAFDPRIIRLTARRHGLRTEAAVRFEKHLDPNSNTFAIARCLKLFELWGLPGESAEAMISVGHLAEEHVVNIALSRISARLGVQVPAARVAEIMTKLGCGVQQFPQDSDVIFCVTVPTYRSTKDITIPEDIIEEIGRFVGYDTLAQKLPVRQMAPFSVAPLFLMRGLKHHCAYALGMHETAHYMVLDAAWCARVGITEKSGITIINPLSQDRAELVPSLIPNMLKTIEQNMGRSERLSFFEVARTWNLQGDQVRERTALASVTFAYKQKLSFYDVKEQVQTLCAQVGISLEWRPATNPPSWFDLCAVADIYVGDQYLGQCGLIREKLINQLGRGSAMAFELDAQFLAQYVQPVPRYEPVPRYQSVILDVSMFVPHAVTVRALEDAAAYADPRIRELFVKDYFEDPATPEKRAVTLRCIIADAHKTMTKEEIDTVWNALVSAVVRAGATVRS